VTRIIPVLLLPPAGDSRTDLLARFEGWLRPVEVFFHDAADTLGDDSLRLGIGNIRLHTAPVDLTQSNPWLDVRGALVRLGYDLDGPYRVLCWLAGWHHPDWAAWSLANLCVIGDVPYARTDDDESAWFVAHELAHLLVSPNHRDPSLSPPDLLRGYLVPLGLPHCILRPEPGRVAGVKDGLTTEPVGCRLGE
jgi:hypothetical protein